MDVSNTTSREGQWIHKATPQSSLNWARASKGAIRNFGNEEFDFVIVAMPYEKSWHSFKTPTTGKKGNFQQPNATTLVTTLVKVTPFQDYTTLNGRKSVTYLYDC